MKPEPVAVEEIAGFAPVDLYQKREKIITRHVDGKFQKARFFTGWPLLIGYLALPWLNYEGRQAILFDLPARQFNVFGLSFWPQDFWLLGWMLMLAAFALFTITNVVGRLWCGYTCPQTVWTAIFMWIEQLCEGSRNQRMKLDRAPWSLSKLYKRGSKHMLWLGWAGLTGLTFVGYFTPVRDLSWQLITFDFGELGVWAPFWITFFTVATYVNAGWLREQVCLYMCPYARFQSAMIDRDTLIVSYDEKRGEPRGSLKRTDLAANQAGQCIDCQLCVQVCPTGIDIREGLQYECIGCAHCIDACNEVMTKIDAPPNLISYTSLNALDGGALRWLRPRSVGYACVCAVLAIALSYAIFTRVPMDFDIIRDRGSLYVELETGGVRNDYQLVVMNKSQDGTRYNLEVVTPDWIEIASDKSVNVAAGGLRNLPFTLIAANPQSANAEVTIRLCAQNTQTCVVEQTRFLSNPAHASIAQSTS